MNDSQQQQDENSVAPSKEGIDIETIELGDVIQINAPANGAIHKQTYYVFYIDAQKLKLLNTSNHQLLKLRVDGYVADESIVSIDLLSRSPFAGYARQHKLEPPQWIDVHFGGDMPVVISGEITNLEEDMIEITTYPGMRVIYVDFAYQGIPEDLPIEKIVLRERPKALQTSLRALASQQDEFDVEQEATAEFDETTGLMTVNVPEGASANPSPEEVIEEFLAEPEGGDDDDDEELESLNVAIAVPESERRYSEEMQVADLLGELVSRLPADQRTPAAMKDIHKFVGRFKELRRLFSTFDDNGDVLMPKRTDVMQKPLIDRIVALDKEIPWIVPVVHERNELISITDEKHEDVYNGAASHIETEMSALVARLGPVNRYFREKRPLGIEGNQYDAVARIVDATITAAPANDLEPESAVFLKDREVKTDIECIVSNDSNYGMDSSVAKQGSSHETSVHRLTTRRYTVASNRMILDENSRRRIYHRTAVGVPDRVNVRSVLMMPRAVLLQSHSRSPSANLYLKSKLAEIPVYKFRFLKRGTTVAKREVENLDEEISYENTCVNFADNNVCSSNESTDQFLSSRPVHYTISDDDASSPEASEEVFRRFLDAIIPRTRNLLYWMKPSMTHLYTQADIIATLEPFLIEQENVTFKQWKDVKFYVKEKIKTYKAAFVAKRKEYEALRGLVSATPINRIQTMLKEKADFQQVMLSSYPFLSSKQEQDQKPELNTHSSETLQNLIATDGTAAYASLLNLYLMEFLTIPESVVGIMKPPTISSETTNTIIKSKCGKRFLTKKYHSVAALRKDDNTKDIFYDKEYDDTPYFLADKYKDEKKRFGNDEEFREFFVETLIQKHDCPPHLAPTLANTILLKKKRVQIGEYAILEIRPTLVDKLKEVDLEEIEKREVEKEADTRKFMEFYKRAKGDVWELDKTVSMDAFIDSNTLFCELSESCNKLTDVAQCVPGEMAALQMRLSKRARMMEEFEDRVARSFEEVAKELRAKLSQMRVQNRRGKVIDDMRLYRQNYRSYEIGKTATSTELVAQSPHVELRERVLGWPDFVAKQGMICVFVDKFCRAPMQNQQDDEHWLYCKDTNTRLFPQSIHRLAMAFAFDQYQQELDRVIRECGQMSDDGDSIVDKYTGYVLRQIEFSAEEGFDEAGFKVSSNAVVEETDIGTMVLNALNKKDRVFEDPTTQAVYNVFKTLSENMGIQKEAAESSIEEFVLRVSLEMLRDETVVQNETAYNELQAERAKQQSTKRATTMPYKTYFNQLLIIIVGCATFAAMQTLIPTFKTKKTFPGCVKSFAGFPLDEGNTDNSPGLRYVACVIDKSKRASSQPWASIEPLGLEILLKRLKLVMKEYVYPRKDVAHLYKIKRDYLVNYPEETVPEEVSLAKWTLFQPPLIPFSLDGRAATGITEEFEKELFRAIMQGSAEQFKMIGALKGKALKHGYAVFDAIDHVVRKKQALLTTSAGAAFLENACCNEGGPHLTPIAYFQKERPELEQLLKKTAKVDDVMNQIKRLSKAKTLFDPKSSRLVGAAVPDTIISRVVYETFIHYCNFDNDAHIPSDLSSFASKKPEYNRFASLDDKITYLKRHGHSYGINEFHSLMRIVNNRNIVSRKPDKTIDSLGGIKDMLDYFEETNSTLVEQKLRELLRATLEEYDPKVALHEERASIRKLDRYLQRATDKMREEILTFLTTHANLSASQVAKTENFLKNAAEWNLSDRKSGAKEVENIVLNLSKVYPNKLRTGTFQTEMPKHWNFSPAHRIYLEKETEAFFRTIAALQEESKDRTFQKYLKTVISSVADLALFLEQIPMFAPMMKDGVEYWSLYSDETVRFLQEYCLLSVLHEYVIIANDRDFIQMRAEEIRTSSRVEDDESPGSFEEEDLDEDYGAATQIRQMRIVESDAAELKKLVGKFMMAMIDRERQTKESINYSYAEIMERTMGLKYKDKKGITDYLAGLSRDERRVEQALRSHKIGRWNVGMQKGLYQYDKGVYDKEIEQWHQGQDPTGMPEPEGGLEVDDLAREEQAQQSADYDGGDGWENLNEDYTDGVYYEEDAERGDYDEY